MARINFYEDIDDIMVDPLENFSIGVEDWSTDDMELDELAELFD